MPEGDTLRQIAARLEPLLAGQPLQEVWLRVEDRFRPGPRDVPLRPAADLEGCVVARVHAIGKHLLLHVGSEVIRVHLGMRGTWHRYAPGEKWRWPRGAAWVVLRTGSVDLVCFHPKTVARLPADRLDRDEALARLGPDLLGEEVPWGEVLARARAAAPDDGTIGTLLLDQSVAAGIGNVFKSEVLFLERVDPFTPREEVVDPVMLALYRRARALLVENAGRAGPRRTRPRDRVAGPVGPRTGDPRLWVYGRQGRPCLVCNTLIRARPQGHHARVTCWCPACQTRIPSRAD